MMRKYFSTWRFSESYLPKINIDKPSAAPRSVLFFGVFAIQFEISSITLGRIKKKKPTRIVGSSPGVRQESIILSYVVRANNI